MTQGDSSLHEQALMRVLDVARLLSASGDRREILTLIIDAMRDVLDAERATVFEYDAGTNELYTTVAHGVGEGEVGEIRIPATQGIAGQAAQERSIINVPDAYADERFDQAVDRETGFTTRSILSIPLLSFDAELIGVAQVLNKRGGPFQLHDERIAEALASQAAVAIRRARLLEDRLVREKLERDLQLARDIQQSTFPEELPSLPGYDIAGWTDPADETGGDAYDLVGFTGDVGDSRIVDHGTPADRVAMMIADATGHGVGPALSVTELRAMLRMAARMSGDFVTVLRHVNDQLCEDLPSGRFITSWMGSMDRRTHGLTCFSAGQGPLLLYRAADDSFDSPEVDMPPLGVAASYPIRLQPPIPMHVGDIFAAISDGFFESANAAGELMGRARIEAVLREHRDDTSQGILESLREAVDAFTGGAPAEDDRTAMIVKRRE